MWIKSRATHFIFTRLTKIGSVRNNFGEKWGKHGNLDEDYAYRKSGGELVFMHVPLISSLTAIFQLSGLENIFLVYLEPQKGGDTDVFHSVQITLCIVKHAVKKQQTDGLLGSMLWDAESLQKTLAIIWKPFCLYTDTQQTRTPVW